ncbi:MAG TPA: SMC family ATPase [Longimicrobiales bacterium]|nr:SMC family ATPase [Longimicrobiales bacterium]
MRLTRLKLTNFRQHRDTEVVFREGLTGVVGPNGAGKSTLLEAVAWAIYGAPAARGTNDTIRFLRAEGRAPVRVELDFALGGHEYHVRRSLTAADVFLDGGEDPVATSVRGATEYLERRLGMSRSEFFNTYFTGQKELQFLAQMGPAERGRFLGQVLGFERLRVAQERLRVRRNELRHEATGLRAGLPDPAVLRERRQAAASSEKEARAAAERAETRLADARKAVEELAPKWEQAQAEQERRRDLEHRLELARRELVDVEREIARAAEELKASAGAEADLAPLREALAGMPALAKRVEQLAERSRLAERRKALAEREQAVVVELKELGEKLAARDQAPELAERFRGEIDVLRGELDATVKDGTDQRDAWQQSRQEVETRLQTYRDRTAELQQQLDQLREEGPEGTCPTCKRPLHDHYDQVMRQLEDEWVTLVQDGKWLKQRQKQLVSPPEALGKAEARREELTGLMDRKREKLQRCEVAIDERKALAADVEQRDAELERLRGELAGLPADYDAEAHRAAEQRLAELREFEKQAAKLEEQLSRRERVQKQHDEAAARRDAVTATGKELRAELDALAVDRKAFDVLRAEQEGATEVLRRAELDATEKHERHEGAVRAVEQAREAEAEYQEKAKAAAALELEQRYHTELDNALTELRGELNARVRPELGQLASTFLTEITDGRYNALEVDDSYNVLVLDDGEEKPVISGGEEDVANLVLRLAISQMIAERAGHVLNALIMDEVFGSLDVDRRDNVVQLLHRLTDRFEQVILITHIETIVDSLDHVVRVSFDENTGASTVREEVTRVAVPAS